MAVAALLEREYIDFFHHCRKSCATFLSNLLVLPVQSSGNQREPEITSCVGKDKKESEGEQKVKEKAKIHQRPTVFALPRVHP